jgi:hypothetical protein
MTRPPAGSRARGYRRSDLAPRGSAFATTAAYCQQTRANQNNDNTRQLGPPPTRQLNRLANWTDRTRTERPENARRSRRSRWRRARSVPAWRASARSCAWSGRAPCSSACALGPAWRSGQSRTPRPGFSAQVRTLPVVLADVVDGAWTHRRVSRWRRVTHRSRPTALTGGRFGAVYSTCCRSG